MRRRELIAGLGGAIAWPVVMRAQQQSTRQIGYVGLGLPGNRPELVSAFQEGLRSVGYVDGQNVVIEYRWAGEHSDRLPGLFSELIARNVAVIFTSGNVALRMARAATTTIPIVFYIGTDPIAMGYVASINRPGGNLTGVSLFNISLGAKQLEFLHQLVRANSIIAVLSNPENPSADLHLKDLREAAQKLGHEIRVARASRADDFAAIFEDLVQHRIASIVIDDDALFNDQRVRLAELAARHSIAAIYSNRETVADGGLMSYGGDLADAFRQCGIYTGEILKGERPGDLPVFQPTKFEFAINLKTAKALGLTIPEKLLATADEVIQ